MLSASDLLLGLFCQNLLFAMFYATKCTIIEVWSFLVTLFLHSSCYTVAMIGLDRYLRIKHYRNFWDNDICIEIILRSGFLCFDPSSTRIDRFCIEEAAYCYTTLYCNWWCCDSFDNITSNSDYPNIKCST